MHHFFFITVTLRNNSYDVTGEAQKIVQKLRDNRPNEFAQLPRDPDWISEDRHREHDYQRGEARDGVNRTKVLLPIEIHNAHADQVEYQPDGLQNPMEMLVGPTRKTTGQDVVARQNNNGLRHQQDVLKRKIDSLSDGLPDETRSSNCLAKVVRSSLAILFGLRLQVYGAKSERRLNCRSIRDSTL